VLISAGALYLAFRGVHLHDLMDELARTNIALILLGVLLLFLSHLCRAWRWTVIVRPMKAKTSVLVGFKAIMGAYAMNNIIPRSGELIRPYIFAKHEKVFMSGTIATILIERVADLISNVLFMMLALIVFPEEIAHGFPSVAGAMLPIAAGMVVLLTLVVIMIFSAGKTERVLHRIVQKWPDKMRVPIERAATEFASGLRGVRASGALPVGGGTVLCDMPLNAHPPTLDAASFDLKVRAAAGNARTDFALWGGLTPGNLDDLEGLAERGVIGFKAFMSNSGVDDFEAADDVTLLEGMRQAAVYGLPVAVHAENDSITAALTELAKASGLIAIRDYFASRPAIAEIEAISRAILFAEETGCSLHVVHVSTGRGVALIAEARTRGIDVTAETCPHYLHFTEDDVERIGALAKCAPPIRPSEEREALWKAIDREEIQIVASDHSPAHPSMKQSDNFFAVWGGISGCQSTLQALLSEGFHARGVGLEAIARLVSTNVASRFSLPGKGRLEVGFDADFALVDLNGEHVLRNNDLHYLHKQSPYAGLTFKGTIKRTILRGRTIAEDGVPVSDPRGQLIRPELQLPSAMSSDVVG